MDGQKPGAEWHLTVGREARSSSAGRNWTEREQAFRGGNDIKMGEDCIWRVPLFVSVWRGCSSHICRRPLSSAARSLDKKLTSPITLQTINKHPARLTSIVCSIHGPCSICDGKSSVISWFKIRRIRQHFFHFVTN